MEKTVFLFRRKAARTRPDFARYYIQNHAPLGRRLTRCLLGYAVNIVESEGGPDAVTEHWVPRALDLLTPDVAYATPEDFNEVLVDDRTLFDSFELYVVVEETQTVPGEPLDSPLGEPTPETKLIWMYTDAKTAPPPPTGARRVVDNRVGHKLVMQDGAWKAVAPEFELIRMAWGTGLDPNAGTPTALVVREHRFIPAPVWPAPVWRSST